MPGQNEVALHSSDHRNELRKSERERIVTLKGFTSLEGFEDQTRTTKNVLRLCCAFLAMAKFKESSKSSMQRDFQFCRPWQVWIA